MKFCPKCRLIKRPDCFYLDSTRLARNKLNGFCKKCRLGEAKTYRAKHRDRIRAYLKRYHALNPAVYKHHNLMQSYGLSLEDFKRMVVAQKGRCAICGRHHSKCPKGKGRRPRVRLCVDHDHKTGVVRGLLCHNCNSRLDRSATPEILVLSARYLRKHSKRKVG